MPYWAAAVRAAFYDGVGRKNHNRIGQKWNSDCEEQTADWKAVAKGGLGKGAQHLHGTARSGYYLDWKASCRLKWAKQKCDNNLLPSLPQLQLQSLLHVQYQVIWMQTQPRSSGGGWGGDELTQPAYTLCCFALHSEGRGQRCGYTRLRMPSKSTNTLSTFIWPSGPVHLISLEALCPLRWFSYTDNNHNYRHLLFVFFLISWSETFSTWFFSLVAIDKTERKTSTDKERSNISALDLVLSRAEQGKSSNANHGVYTIRKYMFLLFFCFNLFIKINNKF